ncbi:methylenetetrahydrofolate reductase [Thiothrix eikelboomii]|uniref:Methylenetetrahydrofolate reductase n=1 Tax=Thiothrix eikelboomii TaxID=92487 RepID=A0A1T4WIJ1_9GAMM|nr:methylenetetrahydrofolate reductase [Thiothrix eikelboomii]SKA77153.1 methylenetetrahydrofolate reductase (NADPH) [Thiothrix eikelboomii]
MTSPILSFEFFPPKTPRMERTLWRNIGQLEMLKPAFFSVTYGALGSERDHSLDTVFNMQRECQVPVAAHLTAAGHTRESLLALATRFKEQGVQRIVALRGDADLTEGGLSEVADMVQALHTIADFDISVAAYPETHPKAANLAADIQQLKRKLDAGAKRALTQYFFEPEMFLRFRDAAVKAGIQQSLVPGILPVHDFDKVISFSARCGATVPNRFHSIFEGTVAGSQEQKKLGIELAVDLCEKLMAEGVNQLHFYTLNIPSLTFEVAHQLGLPLAWDEQPHLKIAA